MKFQFHYGSIEAGEVFETARQDDYFNSTMVRLRQESNYKLTTEPDEFQFHYGSIEASLLTGLLVK